MPPRPKISKTDPFKPGTLVEISSDEQGFRGSWYLGTIVRRYSKNSTKYVVQYEQLFKDDEGTKPLRETLELVQLRPAAPREKERRFKFSEEVDAYYNDGWWEGVITGVREDGKFEVYFRTSKEQIAFGPEDLRLHREWINGQWKPPLEGEENAVKESEKVPVTTKVKPNKSKVQNVTTTLEDNAVAVVTGEKFTNGMAVEVSSDEEGFEGAWFPASIVEAIGEDKYLIEYQHFRTEDDTAFLREEIDRHHIRPCPPETIVVDRFKLLDEVDALYQDAWWVGVIVKVLADSKYMVYFRDSGENTVYEHRNLRIHKDWINGQWVTPLLALKQ